MITLERSALTKMSAVCSLYNQENISLSLSYSHTHVKEVVDTDTDTDLILNLILNFEHKAIL